MEDRQDFAEKNPESSHFFKSGLVGKWREELTDAQVALMVEKHGEMMEKYDYLPI